jgi:hypothetical protein
MRQTGKEKRLLKASEKNNLYFSWRNKILGIVVTAK